MKDIQYFFKNLRWAYKTLKLTFVQHPSALCTVNTKKLLGYRFCYYARAEDDQVTLYFCNDKFNLSQNCVAASQLSVS